MTANLQARHAGSASPRRWCARTDGRATSSLIGPKRYDAPWKDIEAQGWIAPADCVEVRVTLPSSERIVYATASPRSATGSRPCTHHKIDVVRSLVDRTGQPTLVIGRYIDQLDRDRRRRSTPRHQG